MPTVAENFIADIIAHREDDTPRLIYADWLDDHGQADRAEFIRVQIEVERLRNQRRQLHGPEGVERIRKLVRPFPDQSPQHPDCIEDHRLCREINKHLSREHELLHSSNGRGGFNCWDWIGNATEVVPDGDEWAKYVYLSRGFVSKITCTADDWLKHADALLHNHPIEAVRLTTWPDAGYGDINDVVRLATENGPIRNILSFPARDIFPGQRATVREACRREWPTITFEFPSEN